MLPYNYIAAKKLEDFTLEEILEGQVFLVDKPITWSSFQGVNKLKTDIRSRFKVKKFKIGHAGTLDPLATGLLIICTGKQTKSIPTYQAGTKEYTGTITIGASTPSYDLETEFDETFPTDHITEEAVLKARDTFLGDILQTPPTHSAVKVDGRRAYKSARKGIEVIINRRLVTIKEFDVDFSTFPVLGFRIVCEKGTYIRSIANDFGKVLGSGSHLSSLRRTKIGDFEVPTEEGWSPLEDSV